MKLRTPCPGISSPTSRLAPIPIRIVSPMPIGSRPGCTSLPSAPTIRPTTTSPMISPIMPVQRAERGIGSGAVSLARAGARERPPLHEAPVEQQQDDRAEDREDDAARVSEEDPGDDAAEERAEPAEQPRLPPGHRIGSRHGEPRERSHKSAEDDHDDERDEHL